LLLCTIQIAVSPSPAVASTGYPVVYLQSAVAIQTTVAYCFDP